MLSRPDLISRLSPSSGRAIAHTPSVHARKITRQGTDLDVDGIVRCRCDDDAAVLRVRLLEGASAMSMIADEDVLAMARLCERPSGSVDDICSISCQSVCKPETDSACARR